MSFYQRSKHALLLCAALLCAAITAPLRAQDAMRVETTLVRETELVNEVPINGTVSSLQIATVSTQIAGLISAVHVDAGDRVQAGEVLLELDREISEIALEQARAEVTSARETLADSQRRLEEAQSLASEQNIAATEVRSLEAEVSIDQAALQAAQATLRQREAELQRHSITAPFAGTVSRKLSEVGEWLSPGDETLELVNTEQLRLDFQVPQRFYPDIDESTRLTVSIAGLDEDYPAQVQRKVPLSDNDARTFLLRAELADDAQAPLIPGMSAQATLQLAVNQSGPTVPRDALVRYPDGRVSVWLIAGHDANSGLAEVREQAVETGLDFAERVEIRSGLEPGQEVITRGNEALRQGQQVRVLNGDG